MFLGLKAGKKRSRLDGVDGNGINDQTRNAMATLDVESSSSEDEYVEVAIEQRKEEEMQSGEAAAKEE
eukprot:10590064-Ditylum_brightwellii.AAC.1